jgi:hypothetical protein
VGHGEGLEEERTISGQIRKGVKSGQFTIAHIVHRGVILNEIGKLDISSLSLDRIPADVYTALLGIPSDSLSRPPPPPQPKETGLKPLRGGASAGISTDSDRNAVFNQPVRETWADPEELTSLKGSDNRILELEVEIGAFGGLRTLDVSWVVAD